MKLTIFSLFCFSLFFINNVFSFQEKNNKSTFDSIYKKVIFFSKNNKNTEGLFYSKKLLKKSLESKEIIQRAKSYYKIAEFQRKLNFKDSAFYYYNKSKKLYVQENDSIQIGRCLLNIAIIESGFGDYISSDINAINGLKYLNGKREKTIMSSYNSLAINSKKQQLYGQAIYNYNKALSFNLSKTQKIIIKNNMANVYKELKDYSKAILIFQELLKEPIESKKTEARIIDNLVHTKWLRNSNINILKELLKAKSIRENEQDNYGLMSSYNHLSDYYKKNDKSKSLLYALKSYHISKNQKSVNGQMESIDKIVALQTPQKSIKYFKEGIRLRDSLQKVNTQRQNKFAKIKYNYEEEEKQKLKFEKLAIENKLRAEQENGQKKNILIIGVLLTCGLVLLIYRRKQQHKKRILQESYNTETRIAKKLHDELGNDIFNTLTKVQNPNIKTEEIVNDLDKIYLQTRAISHENDSIETGINFENYFRGLVSSYNSDSCNIMLKDLSSLELNNLNNEKQIVLYRVFNELFVNMKKHSKASLVVLSCKKINNDLEIIYADNGIGFKENTIVFKNGLKNMKMRIKKINGTINFENKPDKGLKVIIHFKK